ncbi:MAG: adenylyltransferase/cytidyltransferase family protein [Methanospirillum sp.]|nr:adenylyltransferase/cytidyltransferase family protein [Methanospirillum sp.]
MIRRVVATGTFDILHPGHLWYLNESARLGSELWVIVARDENVKHKPRPVIPEEQRVIMVGALKGVFKAVLGDQHDMFRPIEEIRPDVITLGFNQHFQENRIREALTERGLKTDIVRISEYTGTPFTSSRSIGEEIRRRSSDTRSC